MQPRAALRIATAAYVLGIIAQNSWLFFVGPIVLRASGQADLGAYVFAASAFATMLCVVPAGHLVDKKPRRWGIRIGLALLAASYLPVLAAPTFGGAIAASALSGAGLAFVFVAFQPYIADVLAQEDRAAAYGSAGAIAILVSALGPFAGALVFATTTGESHGVVVSSLLFLLCALVGLALSLLLPSARAGTDAPSAPVDGRAARRAIVGVSAMYVFLGAAFGLSMPYFSVYFLQHLALPSEGWGVLLAFGTVASAAGFYLAGRLARPAWATRVLVGGQAAALACVVPFAVVAPFAVLAVAYPLRLLAGNLFGPLVSALIMERVAPASRGVATAYAALAWNLAWAAGALVGGPLLAAWGGRAFLVGGALGLVGVLVGARLLAPAREAT